jgi:hypothetical protein
VTSRAAAPAVLEPVAELAEDVSFQERLLGLDRERDVEGSKSTSASAPGSRACGTDTSTRASPSSTLRRATYRHTVTSASVASCSVTRRCYTRRAVCRCLRGTTRSASSQESMISTHGSDHRPLSLRIRLAWRRYRVSQRLPHRAPVHVMLVRELADRELLDPPVTPDLLEQLHPRPRHPDLHARQHRHGDRIRGGAEIRDDTPPHPRSEITTQVGPEFVTISVPAGASSGDHTHSALRSTQKPSATS